MLFCPKCKSILRAATKNKKRVMVCSCGFTNDGIEKITEKISDKSSTVEVIDKEVDTNPLTKAKCDKCGHNEARYWFLQTRAGDEPETRFLKCEKCKHTWREY